MFMDVSIDKCILYMNIYEYLVLIDL